MGHGDREVPWSEPQRPTMSHRVPTVTRHQSPCPPFPVCKTGKGRTGSEPSLREKRARSNAVARSVRTLRCSPECAASRAAWRHRDASGGENVLEGLPSAAVKPAEVAADGFETVTFGPTSNSNGGLVAVVCVDRLQDAVRGAGPGHHPRVFAVKRRRRTSRLLSARVRDLPARGLPLVASVKGTCTSRNRSHCLDVTSNAAKLGDLGGELVGEGVDHLPAPGEPGRAAIGSCGCA